MSAVQVSSELRERKTERSVNKDSDSTAAGSEPPSPPPERMASPIGPVATVLSFFAVHVATWQVFVAYWSKDWAVQKQKTEELRARFVSIPVAPCLMLNALTACPVSYLLVCACGFSSDLKRFACCGIYLPVLVGCFGFYLKKFGTECLRVHEVLGSYLHNWLMVCSMAAVCWTHHLLVYFAALLVEPVMPARFQGVMHVPLELTEHYFQSSVLMLYGFGALLLLGLPWWVKGYAVSMQIAGRKAQVGMFETACELVYQACGAGTVYMFVVPLATLHSQVLPFHAVHLLLGAIETLLINEVVGLKFAFLHGIAHEIKPLYNMVHLEHHVCKTIHPCCSAAGIWEFWFFAGEITFNVLCIVSLPYLHFQMVHCGANILVHTMWPSKKYTQWHTLHHVVLADVYNVNIPSDYDKANSKDVPKYSAAMQESLFVQNEKLSDLVALGMMIVAMSIGHFVFGCSIFAVWGEIQWTV